MKFDPNRYSEELLNILTPASREDLLNHRVRGGEGKVRYIALCGHETTSRIGDIYDVKARKVKYRYCRKCSYENRAKAIHRVWVEEPERYQPSIDASHTPEATKKMMETRMSRDDWEEWMDRWWKAGTSASRSLESRMKHSKTKSELIQSGKFIPYSNPLEFRIKWMIINDPISPSSDACHAPRVINGVKELDVYSPTRRKAIEVDEAKGHIEYKDIYKKCQYGAPEGYHHRKDEQAEAQGIIVYHLDYELYKRCPDYCLECMITWWRYGTETVPSVYDTVYYPRESIFYHNK